MTIHGKLQVRENISKYPLLLRTSSKVVQVAQVAIWTSVYKEITQLMFFNVVVVCGPYF
jgi:hypothetical protein